MAQMLVAAFPDQDQADRAITELEEAGFDSEDISIVTLDEKTGKASGDNEAGKDMVEGAVGGATTGGVIGGLAGLLAGAEIIPALSGLLIGGPIAAALGLTGVAAATVSGAVTGAAAGSLVGALTNLGLSEDVAKSYDETIREGGIVLGVPVSDGEDAEVRRILDSHGAEQVQSVETK